MKKLLSLIIVLLTIVTGFTQTLDTNFVRQKITANPGYDYIGLGALRSLTMPRGQYNLSQRDSGSIAYINHKAQLFDGHTWAPLSTVSDTAESLFGFRYNKQSWANLADFTDSGSAATVVSNAIRFRGGASDYSKKLYVTGPTCLEHQSFTTRFVCDSGGAGIAVGLYSYNFLGANTYMVAKFETLGGTLSLALHSTGTPNIPLFFIQAPGSCGFSTADTLEMVLDQQGVNLIASIRNLSTHEQKISVTYTYSLDNRTGNRAGLLNNGRLGIWNLGGNYSIKSLQWFIYEPLRANLMIVGDSKAKYFASAYGLRFSDLLNDYYGTTINGAGSGDATVDVLTRTDEIISLKPKRVLLSIGSNDLRHSISGVIAHYDTIVNRLTAAGIDVYHQLGFYEPALDQSSLTNHIISTYSASKIIDCLTPTTQDDILIDGAHGFDDFQFIVFKTVVESNKLGLPVYRLRNSIVNQTRNVQDAAFNISGPGLFKGQLTKLVLNNTFPSINTDPLFDLLVTDSSLFKVSKQGFVTHKPNLAGVMETWKVPANQYPNAAWQIQDSTGAPMLEVRTNTKFSIFIGVNAGINNALPANVFAAGAQNVGIGGPAGFSRSALMSNTTGLDNVGIGGAALGANTTGSFGTAVGCNALLSNTTGNNNTALGQAALAFATTASDNEAFGWNALRNATTGGENVGMGSTALWSNSTGTGNVAIGIRAAALSPSQSGIINTSNCTVIGWQAAQFASLGFQNTIIGNNSHAGSSLGNNNVMIGSAQSASGSINNSTLIGDSMSTTLSNIAGIGNDNQNVIVGKSSITTNNGYKLQVNGAASIKDSARIGNIPTGTSTDSLATIKNGVIHKIAQASITDFDAGTYSPNLDNTTNLGASVTHDLNWSRTKNMWNVFGYVEITATAANTATTFDMDLPAPGGISGFLDQGDAGGSFVSENLAPAANISGGISANTATGHVTFAVVPSTTSGKKYRINFWFKLTPP